MDNKQETEMLNKLAKAWSDSIDTEVLYTVMGWTIVKIPHPWYIPHLLNNVVTDWLDEHCGEYHSWDGQVAFKEGKDATMFILRWS